MNILITGSTGQVGYELCRSLALFGQIKVPTRQELDLEDPLAVDEYLKIHKPDLIVNACAYTAVDRAESEPEKARRLNMELPAQLAEYAHAKGIWLVHYSSDYVYPGIGDTPFSEVAPTGPLGVYGKTKLEGDEAIAASGCRYLIFRTSWVYSARGNNFLKTMLRLAEVKNSLNVVADQIGAPTPARLIAGVTAVAVCKIVSCRNYREVQEAECETVASGIYHLSPTGETSWYDFAQSIFRLAAAKGKILALELSNVNPIPTGDYPTPAKRPLNSRLDLKKIQSTFGLSLPSWQDQLALTLTEYLEKS
ncbi:dTDP-4-dehydrorhamnose reductase [Marinobacterium lutimaris]|uniref:dTDP-4-dehydrorhamnose reductase n=1 Tax=Marinobacterium lutimaris TaxID=568106 RepID=A0A1H6B4E4_9GAMM|nr:dTDP-4-dehydrorhamnose reductase [Marinobacterium lutimaris]SEG55087.1 dTDP-4-dehydrorhamnose reductase [Marinobacterium lutimaris]